ncbi:MMPL family transporter [Jatrophihabitans fulvus]
MSRPSRREPATVRVARWSATHPWRAISLWLAFVTVCIALGSTTTLRQATDLDQAIGQSGQAARWVHDAGLEKPDTENVLVSARSGRLDPAAARAALADATRGLRTLPQVTAVGRPVTSPDGAAMTVSVTLAKDADVQPLLDETAAVQRAHAGVRVEQVGDASLDEAMNTLVDDDLGSAAVISTPVTLLILLVAFGAIVAAGVPVLLALSAVGAATGLSALASHLVPDSGSTSAMILLMGMAVGVDYSLFYVRRVREERRLGHGTLDAVEIAARTSGHSVLVSGVAVIVSMLGMYLAGSTVFDSLATGSIIVVAVAVIGSLTVLPALLVKLGRAVDRPRVPVLWRLTAQVREPRLWPAVLRPSLHRPGRTLALSSFALLLLALPALGLHLQTGSIDTLPSSLAEKHTLQRLNAAFPDQRTTTTVVVRTPAARAAETAASLRDLGSSVDRRYFQPGGEVTASSDRTVQVLTLTATGDDESPAARDGVRLLRDGLVARTLPDGARWAVGGGAALSLDADTHLADRLPWVIGFVVLLTMLMTWRVFRSPLLAVATAGMNLLSAGASFGVLVLVFQHSWAESLLGFTSTGRVVNWIPLFMFAVLFGLSMDYHVFVLGRVREAVRRGLPAPDAVREGIVGSAGTITSAALIMVSVFAIFAALHVVEMKQFGVGLAVAVLIDAVVVRGVVLPSVLVLAGDRAWGRRRVTPPAREPALV